VGGLTSEEAVEIMYVAGKDKRVKSLDVTDYNPTIDDYRSGYMVGNLIYYFSLGRGKSF
jgi:formiminoglutamase